MRISDCSSSGCGSCCSPSPVAPQQQQQKQQRAQRQESPQSGVASVSASAQGRQSTKAELALTTADGDKVTLSFSSANNYQYAGDYSGLRRSASAASSSSATVEIKVEGNLSKQELADIQKLAKIVAGAATSALRGDTGKAAEKIEQTRNLETIQNFAFSLNRTVERAYSYEATLDQLR